MLKLKSLALLTVAALGFQAMAAVPEEDGTSSIQASVPAAQTFQPRFTGTVELRPSFITEGSEFHSENLIDFGYQFTPNFRVTLQQQFNTNLSDPYGVSQSEPLLQAGFIRATFSNLADLNGWSLSYEPRLYISENANDFRSQRIASLRNYLMLSRTFGVYTLTFMEIPIFHAHAIRGYVKPNGMLAANQYFENRFYIMNDFTFGNLSISFPILFMSQSKLDFGGVEGNWAHRLWFWPEVTYALSPNVAVGAAVYTESIIASDLSSITIDDRGMGLSHSVAQLILRATL